ncbi:hypothetical protein [Streptomyces sp. NPDC005017]|uniref:hypothetical protein n=1 Tax=Streptomyces sp. NPDC005017 TaxID=3364706 RepID=UPI003683B9AC
MTAQHGKREEGPAWTADEEILDELEGSAKGADPDRDRRREERDGEAGDGLTPSPSAQEDARDDT